MTQFVIVYYTRDIFSSKIADISYRRSDIAAHLTSSILLRILEMTLGVEVIFLLEASSSLAIIQNPAPLSSFTTLIILV